MHAQRALDKHSMGPKSRKSPRSLRGVPNLPTDVLQLASKRVSKPTSKKLHPAVAAPLPPCEEPPWPSRRR